MICKFTIITAGSMLLKSVIPIDTSDVSVPRTSS